MDVMPDAEPEDVDDEYRREQFSDELQSTEDEDVPFLERWWARNVTPPVSATCPPGPALVFVPSLIVFRRVTDRGKPCAEHIHR